MLMLIVLYVHWIVYIAYFLLTQSRYGHIAKLAQAQKEGIEAAGGKVDVYQ